MKKLLTKTWKFTEEEKNSILKMVACYIRFDEISEKIQKKTGKIITKKSIEYYAYDDKYKSKIEEYRKAYESYISTEEFSSKRRRIQELSDIYYKLKKKNLKSAADVMTKIDEVVQGRKHGNTIQLQYNKFEGMTTEDLVKKFQSHSRILLGDSDAIKN